MLRSLSHIYRQHRVNKKLEKTPDETYVFLWIIVHIINVDISYYVLGKRAEWDRKRERNSDTICLWSGGIPQKIFPTFFMSTWWGDCKNMQETWFSRWLSEDRRRQGKKVLLDGVDWLCYLAGSSKKPSRVFNILHIFAIPSSGWHEKLLPNVGNTFCGILSLYKHTVLS